MATPEFTFIRLANISMSINLYKQGSTSVRNTI